MKITTKFQLLSAGLITGLAIACGVALWQSRTTQNDNRRTYGGETVATAALADANSALWALRWGIAQYLALKDPEQKLKLLDADRKHYAEFEEHMKIYAAQPVAEAALNLSREVIENYAKYADARARWMRLMDEGRTEEAAEHRAQVLTPAGAATVGTIGKLIDLQRNAAEAGYQRRNAQLAAVSAGLLAVCLLLIGAGVAASFILVRQLGRELGGEPADAANLARAVAGGDLNVVIDLRPGDGTSLMAQLKNMQSSLASIVSNVRQCSHGVVIAADEIATGNQNLSSRTEQQASSLEETAASMEQLTSTVKQSADNARQANLLASSASEAAAKGGTVVGQVVTTMEEIAAASKKMAEIINVIDGIAFQTNILALNAAVEAARAGEQGRGFAVVAGEVRNLAQRSAQAAREIKGMIQDSVNKVDAGSKLVGEAGVSMQEILGQVKRVSDLIGEVTSAAMEQSSGIGQVNEAVTQMDKATQQNAALVEESAAAAASLKEQAEKLSEVVAVFKLGSAEAGHLIARAQASAKDSKLFVRTEPKAPVQVGAFAPEPRPHAPAGKDKDWEEF